MNILVCDDEKDIVEALSIYLSAEDYTVFKAYNGVEALAVLAENEIHLVLMDVMMPVMDGISATAKIRGQYNIPVILLTAKSEDSDIVLGLNIGADDYITKPFNPLELQARVKSQLRRYTRLGGMNAQSSKLTLGAIELDDEQKQVSCDGEPVSLTPIEYSILKLLMQTPGKVFSSADIYKAVWGEAPFGGESSVAVHIRHLREKTEIDPAHPRYIKVVWGQGYKFEKQL